MRVLSVLWLFCTAIVLTGCASMGYVANPFVVEVDTYGNDNHLSSKRYVIVAGDADMNEEHLQYIEFVGYVKKVLNDKGYEEVSDRNSADVVVFFRYGISNPQVQQKTRAVPIWGETGVVSTTTTSETTQTSPGTTTTTSETKVTPNYGIVGYSQRTSTETTYFRYLILDAYERNVYAGTEKMKMVWSVELTSEGSSSDLRRAIPCMLVAGADYVGRSSETRQSFRIAESDPRIKRLKAPE